ncbi:MAG: TetR/AcrR family transcriptional regulator [Candidatus Heimdallarchaeota archaeon]
MSQEGTKLKKDQRKDSILETAIMVFCEYGLDGATMRQIAKDEGISEPMLYRFFKNKYEILFEVLESRVILTIKSMEELQQAVTGMIPDPAVTLPLIWQLLENRILEHKDVVTLFQKEGPHMREHMTKIRALVAMRGMKDRIPKFMKEFQSLNLLGTFTDYFTRCNDAGNLRNDLEPQHCAHLILNIIRTIPMQHFEGGFGGIFPTIDLKKSSDILETQMKILLYGLVPVKK